MNSQKHFLKSLILIFFYLTISNVAPAKSVYVISNTQTSQLQAYEVQDSNLILQANYVCESDTPGITGSVGIAIDDSDYGQFLFVTFEGQDLVELVNAKTMEYVDVANAHGATNLAGITMDMSKNKLYAVNRFTNHLYSYSWNPVSKILTSDFNDPYYVELEDISSEPYEGAFGIALDEENGLLYVADNTDSIKFYDTNDWSKIGEVNNVSCSVISIAIDVNNQLLYYGSMGSYGQGNPNLYQYDISAQTEDSNTVGSSIAGIAVDQDSSLVYLTTFHDGGTGTQGRLFVYDVNLNQQWMSQTDLGHPAGLAVGSTAAYKPPAFYLEKIDVNEPNCVLPGDYITYKITYGPNGVDHNNVVITDYLPCQVDYINPFDPNYNDVNRTYKWQIGSLSASAPNDFVTLTVIVNLGVEPNGIITNYCEIESDHYCSFAFADTNVCFWSPDIIYVDVNAVGCGSGLSWEHADPNLQRALWKAQAWDVNQIRVAQGTFKPTTRSDTGARTISFELLDGVAIYGGFPAGGGTLSERNPSAYETILNGDIGIPVDQNDNSYHVVQCEDVNNAVLDGFAITAGYADATSLDEPNRCGGGICCKNSNVIKVANCTIIQNEGFYGGGIYNYNSPSLMITNCTFSDNTSFYGGAIYNNYSSSDVNITNCVFTGNTAKYYGGGILNYNSSPAVTNCVFSENQAEGYATYCGRGGGIANYQSSPMITNCTFIGNYVLHSGEGGGMYNRDDSSPSIKYCIFSGNLAGTNGGGLYNYDDSYPKIANCIFTGNKANNDKGGGIYNYYSEPNITNCIFTGNKAEHYGGGIYNTDSTLKVSNSVFAGNIANYNGGGIYNYQCPTTLTNCTFSGNWAGYGGGIYNGYSSDSDFTNCIFWDNEAVTVYDEIYNNSDLSVTYCDVKGGWEGTGNINEDPCFFEVGEPDGSWTEDASYDSSTFQSTLTDSYANWAVNELAGRFVNPDTNQNLQFFIVSNGVNTIKVWSDVESIVTNGKPYQIYDYHLTVDSACIDRGDPAGDYAGQKDIDGEPRVFDGDYNDTEIVDMGADEYYWSPADFNSDGIVNFFDYALLANVWLTTPEHLDYNDIYDLIDNNYIDSNDLGRFCEDWLWQTAWSKTFPFAYEQTMGRGMGMSQAVSESLVVTQDPYPSVLTKEAQPEVIEVDIEVIVKWLFELWLTDDEVRKMISEDDWLKFIESVIQSLKEQIK